MSCVLISARASATIEMVCTTVTTSQYNVQSYLAPLHFRAVLRRKLLANCGEARDDRLKHAPVRSALMRASTFHR
jgi:hypothetical protein